MSSSNGRVVMVLTVFAAAVAVPVLLGSMWSAWRSVVEARNLEIERAAQSGPPVVVEEPPPPPEPPPAPIERKMPDVLLGMSEFQMTADTMTDVEPSLPFRIDLEGREGMTTLARVDLARDGVVDEIWHFRPQLVREVGLERGGTPRRLVSKDGEWVPE